MVKEKRVGYVTIDCLFNETMKYIKINTYDHKYSGKPEYLIKAYNMRKYLNKGEKQ